MLLVQFIRENYWSIESVFYENQDQYHPAANQKIIQNHNWVFKQNGESEVKSNLVWDDLDEQVILYPDHLKLFIYKQSKTKELTDRLSAGNDIAIGEQAIADIVANLKLAETMGDAIAAFEELKKEKDKFLKRVGL